MQHSVAEVVALVMYDEAGFRSSGAGRCLHGMYAAVEAIGDDVALSEKKRMGSSEQKKRMGSSEQKKRMGSSGLL